MPRTSYYFKRYHHHRHHRHHHHSSSSSFIIITIIIIILTITAHEKISTHLFPGSWLLQRQEWMMMTLVLTRQACTPLLLG